MALVAAARVVYLETAVVAAPKTAPEAGGPQIAAAVGDFRLLLLPFLLLPRSLLPSYPCQCLQRSMGVILLPLQILLLRDRQSHSPMVVVVLVQALVVVVAVLLLRQLVRCGGDWVEW